MFYCILDRRYSLLNSTIQTKNMKVLSGKLALETNNLENTGGHAKMPQQYFIRSHHTVQQTRPKASLLSFVQLLTVGTPLIAC